LLTPTHEIAEARARFGGGNVEIIEAPVDDIWMRDIAPTFAIQDGNIIAIDWNFNGWGSTSTRRSRPGDRLAGLMAAEIRLPFIHAPFIAEGGAISTDGEGTVITTKSCLLNPNRNSAFGKSQRERMEDIGRRFAELGGRKLIWLEGDADEPITSGHADAYILFTSPGAILVEGIDPDRTSEASRATDITTLRKARDSQNRMLQVTTVLPPRQRYWRFSNHSFAPCYLNAYVVNGAVITGKFGDTERDEAAEEILEKAFPGRCIRMLTINHIASGGGGVHCLTQPMPAIRKELIHESANDNKNV
jgi:agmatine deiminase